MRNFFEIFGKIRKVVDQMKQKEDSNGGRTNDKGSNSLILKQFLLLGGPADGEGRKKKNSKFFEIVSNPWWPKRESWGSENLWGGLAVLLIVKRYNW